MSPGRERIHRYSVAIATSIIIILLAGAALLQYSLDSTGLTSAPVDDSAPFDAFRSFLDLFGGIRETVAANLWSKTDVLFHEYMNGNIMQEQPLYPYYWLITKLDPRFTRAYYFASWVLCRMGKINEGFDLALEGLRFNPNSALLHENIAQIYFFFKKDPKKARYYVLKAIELTDDEQDKAVQEKFLETIDLVLAGKRTIPDVVPLEVLQRLSEEAEKQEGHSHEHDEHDEHNH